ncbi:hypothetical protein [Paenibacillus endoradicis]|uniref:hypothetical protein n=1 Tax=Paenibacillus endoradicis TaxID=2972487 RepID=UPI002159620A|nr:hypothetical protein [Paenibacillus endoradicis]MCR8659859.1 hypothetical protein [Paenibacillus endoradicis]
MAIPLTEKEVNRLFELLDGKQRLFLNTYLTQSKKSKWLEQLATKKGIVLDGDMTSDEIWDKLDDWELAEVLDGGYGNRPYQCECGKPLRFCYVIHHRKENKTYRLGETCLENYTMLSADLIKDIKSGFHTIDLERDDILSKYEQWWKLPEEYFDLDLSREMMEQLELDLPLSYIQLNKLEKQFEYELSMTRPEQTVKKSNKRYKSKHSIIVNTEPVVEHMDITYEELMSRHSEQLQLIKENENRIESASKQEKWELIQRMLGASERNKRFSYTKFLTELFDLLYYLKLY